MVSMLSLNLSLPNMSVMISVQDWGKKNVYKNRNKQDLKAKPAAVIDLVWAALDSPGIAF